MENSDLLIFSVISLIFVIFYKIRWNPWIQGKF